MSRGSAVPLPAAWRHRSRGCSPTRTHPRPAPAAPPRSITFDPSAEEAKEQEVQILTAEITRAFNLAGGKLKRLANFEAGSDATEMKVRSVCVGGGGG